MLYQKLLAFQIGEIEHIHLVLVKKKNPTITKW